MSQPQAASASSPLGRLPRDTGSARDSLNHFVQEGLGCSAGRFGFVVLWVFFVIGKLVFFVVSYYCYCNCYCVCVS